MDIPETQYTKTPDGTHIAYKVMGDGPFDIVFVNYGSDGNVMTGNQAIQNNNSGFLAVESSHNSIRNNRAMGNNTSILGDGAGISVIQSSSFNEIRRNVAYRNGNLDGYDDGTGTGNEWEGNNFGTSST